MPAADNAVPIRSFKDLDRLIDAVKDARVVMLGEATHGTHEFYEWRRIITEWLVVKHGFRFIAVEGDWPACNALSEFVARPDGPADHAPGGLREILNGFHRWPTWMWSNEETLRLAQWLRSHNGRVAEGERVGFHGIDVYSLFDAVDAVVRKLGEINPFLARRAAQRYACFAPYQHDEHAYTRSLMKLPEGCRDEVARSLQELIEARISLPAGDARLLDAQAGAQVVRNAESYYRSLLGGDEASWNVRDRHMLDMLHLLVARHGRGIVWAHNTHVGDYRATDMVRQGLVNLGGLAREKYGRDQVAIVGFGTYEGTVIASHAWEGPTETMNVPPARAGSYEELFHRVAGELGVNDFYLVNERGERDPELAARKGHRAIGVVYDPGHERWGNYVPTELCERYDAFIFCDRTRALSPLGAEFDRRDIPETWPAGR